MACWAASLLLLHHPILLSGFERMPGDTGDAALVNYILEHGFRWVSGDEAHDRFWDPPYFHPAANVGATTENMLGSAPLYWLPRLAGAAPDTAFQCWALLVTSLNFATTFLALRRGVGLTLWPAAMGAVLFAAAASRASQATHPQLLPQFYTPLALLALLRLADRQTQEPGWAGGAAWVAVLAGAVVGQVYAGFYLGWFLVLALCVGGACALAVAPSRRAAFAIGRRHAVALLPTGLLAGAALLPFVIHSWVARLEVGGRSMSEVATMLPRWQSWVHVGAGHLMYGWTAGLAAFRGLPMEHEHRLGIGWVTAAVAVAGLWGARRVLSFRLLTATGAALILLATVHRGELALWWPIHAAFPGGDGIRAVTRLGLLMLLPAALGVGAALQTLLGRGRTAWALVLSLVMLAEQATAITSYAKDDQRVRIAALVGEIPEECPAFFAVAPDGSELDVIYHVDAMWAQLAIGRPTVNGYSASHPRGWELQDVSLADAADAPRLRTALAAWLDRHERDPASVCWVEARRPRGPDDAKFVAQTVPHEMVAGERHTVVVRFRNIGSRAWSRQDFYRLGAHSPQDNMRWGVARVELAGDVSSGEEADFTFEVVAPASPGEHAFRWGVLREGVHWFGGLTPEVRIRVTESPPAPSMD